MHLIKALEKLQKHEVLQSLSLDDISRYARLVGHLKNDILLPQPLSQTDPSLPPDVLSSSMASFLSEALQIDEDYIQDSWDILKYFIWECGTVELTSQDYDAFKQFGWSRGIAALSIYPPEIKCTTAGCSNTKPLKKEKPRQVVVYTLGNGVQAAWAVVLSCPTCATDYHNNFNVQDGERIYHKEVPLYVQVGEHQFVENTVVQMWINNMVIAWVSASNTAKSYDMSLAKNSLAGTDWQFGSKLTTEHVWDAFVIVSLLEDKLRAHQQLCVPHTGLQKDRFREAMAARNKDFVLNGQPDAVGHACDKCLRTYETEDGEIHDRHPIIGDGLSLGRFCCGVFACPEPLQNNRHRYCKTHFDQHQVCAIISCNGVVTGESDSKTCSNPEHKEFERKNKEKGASNFILKERFRHTQASQPVDTLAPQEMDQVEDIEATTMEWFEVDPVTKKVQLRSQANPGTVGTEDDASPPVPCPSKSAAGNRVEKAQFSRRRTHNEQTLVRPCGIIFARATMFGAEAVSNFLIMTQNAFSVPGVKKPEHIFYDTNCLARQQAEKNNWQNFPWFKGIGMCVDVWHFLNKHQTTHDYCQKNCNPIKFPELVDEFGKWFFNTSVAEQINSWLQGYHSICREMLPDKFDFFLDEMIRRRNVEHLKKLAEEGRNPRVI
ncbi:hypothetical protein B0H34DRAFT_649042 [Crassisporium funariophilum]|nr:hypothetical protein B0H34DRAFT_649042 [Crassisporium funariophilum]